MPLARSKALTASSARVVKAIASFSGDAPIDLIVDTRREFFRDCDCRVFSIDADCFIFVLRPLALRVEVFSLAVSRTCKDIGHLRYSVVGGLGSLVRRAQLG